MFSKEISESIVKIKIVGQFLNWPRITLPLMDTTPTDTSPTEYFSVLLQVEVACWRSKLALKLMSITPQYNPVVSV